MSNESRQFKHIELMLAFEGRVSNQDVRDMFGVQNVQASRILAAYKEKHPHNIKTLSRGIYVPSARFNSDNQRLDDYLSIAAKRGREGQIEDLRVDYTRIDPAIARTLNQAILGSQPVRAVYRSMNHPTGIERTLHPIAFAFAGRRWHVRAFDERRGEHRDFNLARFGCVEPSDSNVQPPSDVDWHSFVQAHIQAHPELTIEQQDLIRDEFFDGAAGRVVHVRKALLHYLLSEMAVAQDPSNQRPPSYQLALYKVAAA